MTGYEPGLKALPIRNALTVFDMDQTGRRTCSGRSAKKTTRPRISQLGYTENRPSRRRVQQVRPTMPMSADVGIIRSWNS